MQDSVAKHPCEPTIVAQTITQDLDHLVLSEGQSKHGKVSQETSGV